ncbi:MAG: hypothetical protein KBS35_00445, partial [Mycoplasma sp.]|nr:hypothetical protein [Candidatus Hennigella equi]
MIRKKWWKALALSGSAATLSFLPIAISSCFEKKPEPTPEEATITLPLKEVTTIEHATQMTIFCSDTTVLELRVGIKNTKPDCLSLVSDTIQMINGAGTIEYIIADSITNPTQILFDLDVAILNPVGRTEVTTFDKCSIIYANQIPDDDKIVCSSFSIDYSNTHVESFNFTFYQEPKSDIKVTFKTEEPEGTLWIDSESYQVQKDPKPEVNLWYLTIPVHLNIRQYKSRAFAFDLELQFINSRGIKQTTKYTNLIVNFIEIDSEEVPLDYYEINSAGKILGIYDSISEQQMSGYTVMRFPEEAESIDGSAFDRVSHFGNIKKIIMPKGIKTIGVDAFSGCTNLFEMDLTDYGDRGPTWFTYGCPRMFVTENMKLKYGYLWTGGIIDKESWDVYPTSMGLPTGWNVFCANQVTPRELYDIDEA